MYILSGRNVTWTNAAGDEGKSVSETRIQTEVERQKQMRAAEELLFAGSQKLGLAKGLFLGRFVADWVMPYPIVRPEEQAELNDSLERLRAFLDRNLDPAAIDRQADIPREVIDGLARLGVFGMTAPRDVGGRGLSQMAYCRVMEEIGSRCASTSIFVNVQHSIGMRALLLFGTPDQKRRWLPPLVNGWQELVAYRGKRLIFDSAILDFVISRRRQDFGVPGDWERTSETG